MIAWIVKDIEFAKFIVAINFGSEDSWVSFALTTDSFVIYSQHFEVSLFIFLKNSNYI